MRAYFGGCQNKKRSRAPAPLSAFLKKWLPSQLRGDFGKHWRAFLLHRIQ